MGCYVDTSGCHDNSGGTIPFAAGKLGGDRCQIFVFSGKVNICYLTVSISEQITCKQQHTAGRRMHEITLKLKMEQLKEK